MDYQCLYFEISVFKKSNQKQQISINNDTMGSTILSITTYDTSILTPSTEPTVFPSSPTPVE